MPTYVCAHTHTDTHTHIPSAGLCPLAVHRSGVGQGTYRQARRSEGTDGFPFTISPCGCTASSPTPTSPPSDLSCVVGSAPASTLHTLPSVLCKYTQSTLLKHASDPADSVPEALGRPSGPPAPQFSLLTSISKARFTHPEPFATPGPLSGLVLHPESFPQLWTCLSLVHSNVSSGMGKFSLGRQRWLFFFFFWSSVHRPHLSHSTHLGAEWGAWGALEGRKRGSEREREVPLPGMRGFVVSKVGGHPPLTSCLFPWGHEKSSQGRGCLSSLEKWDPGHRVPSLWNDSQSLCPSWIWTRSVPVTVTVGMEFRPLLAFSDNPDSWFLFDKQRSFEMIRVDGKLRSPRDAQCRRGQIRPLCPNPGPHA